MIPGSVGFHCPECVRAAPRREIKVRRFQRHQLTSVALVGVNVLVWLAILITGWHNSVLIEALGLTPQGICLVDENSILPVGEQACLAADMHWIRGVSTGAYWQLLTGGFTHVQFWHIGFNMLALLILGPQLEQNLGRARFLALYLFTGLSASLVELFFVGPYTTVVGASGSLFGLMGAILMIAWRRRLDTRSILIWLGINAAFTFLVPNVSWEGHLGGFLGGLGITWVLVYLPVSMRKYRWPLFAALSILLLVGAVFVGQLRFN